MCRCIVSALSAASHPTYALDPSCICYACIYVSMNALLICDTFSFFSVLQRHLAPSSTLSQRSTTRPCTTGRLGGQAGNALRRAVRRSLQPRRPTSSGNIAGWTWPTPTQTACSLCKSAPHRCVCVVGVDLANSNGMQPPSLSSLYILSMLVPLLSLSMVMLRCSDLNSTPPLSRSLSRARTLYLSLHIAPPSPLCVWMVQI